jgi:meiotically up-regulated gene 157 (Mug157) protein
MKLPYQRPVLACRTFSSAAVEKVIEDVTSRMTDKDMARLFENAFPNTLDTTVRWHTPTTAELHDATSWKGKGKPWEGPQSFIVTGDINAEWLRDSTNQLLQYQPLAKKDPALSTLLLGAINTQAEYVIESPYCNAFQPPPASKLRPSRNGQDDSVHPVYEPAFVFECKYELDSLAHFLALTNQYYNSTGNIEFLTARWYSALQEVLNVLDAQSLPTFNEDGQHAGQEYTFQRTTNAGTETLNLRGCGNPLAPGTGLVRSAFRPSDDATILGYFIPANAMMAVELKRTAEIMRQVGQNKWAKILQARGEAIDEGVWEYGVVNHRKYGDVFAYEVDGYGSQIMMDDANIPSLLALPLLGFVNKDNKIYQNTRRMILEKAGNPFYLEGKQFHGIGGPHIGLQNSWPMSLLVQAMTSDDASEINQCLNLVLSSSKLGLVHESIDVNNINRYTSKFSAC